MKFKPFLPNLPSQIFFSRRIEYLLTRLKASRSKPDYENYALEHVLSYQRRIAATKTQFMRRGKKTPLGVLADWWDR